MSKKDENNENKPNRFSRKKRTIDPELAKKLAQQDEDKTLGTVNPEDAEKNTPAPAALDRETLIKSYTEKTEALTAALAETAEKRTALSQKTAARSNLTTKLENEKTKLDTELKRVAAEQINNFLAELKDVQDALGSIVSDIQAEGEVNEQMSGFLTGLSMTGEGLTKVFNQYGGKNKVEDAPEVAPLEAQSYSAESFGALDLDGADKDITDDALQSFITGLESKLTETTAINRELDVKITAASDALAKAEDNIDSEIARAGEQMEQKKSTVLEKIAKSVLEVADNLSRAAGVLTAQKQQLGPSFNAVSERVGKAGDELDDAFKKFGIEKIGAPGDKFDPTRHMAVTMGPATAEIPSGHVLNVAEEGYTLNGKLIRDAKVVVAQ